MTRNRALPCLAAICVVLSACGQFAGVHDAAVSGGPPSSTPLGAIDPPGQAGPNAPSPGEGGADVEAGTTSPTPTDPRRSTDLDSRADAPGIGEAPIGGGDRTGVTDSSLTIGIHAPLTGAAPLKVESFDVGKDLYWLRGNDGKPVTIYGRHVRVVFQDDRYNPSHARAVCQHLVESERVFLLIGGAGADQIQACAQYAASEGVPYLSNGVTEIGLERLANYFAVSMSYTSQAPLLAEYIRENATGLGWSGDPTKIAMVAINTPNFDDVVNAFSRAMPGVRVVRPEKTERGSSLAAILCTGTIRNYELVFPLMAPTSFLEMAGSSKCHPRYVGVGATLGIDQIAEIGCTTGGVEGSRFFSPSPALADVDGYDPLFRRVAGTSPDDVMLHFWGLSKTLHQLLLAAGPDLTREGFIASTEKAEVRSGVYPSLRYAPGDHFGAQHVNVLRAVCTESGGHYVTDQAFVSGFSS